MALRKGTITESGKKITWNQTETGISYSDGKTAIPTADNMDAKLAYKSATVVVVPPIKPPVVDPPIQSDNVVTPVNGQQLNLGVVTKNTTVKAGVYDGIYLTFSKANDVTIDFTGVTFKNSVLELGSGNNVTLLNLVFDGQKYRPFRFDFGLNNLTIKGFKFINCDDYIITSNNSNIAYNGTDATLNKGFKIIDCTFDNSGSVVIGGNFNKDEKTDTGLFKDVEISGNTFKNSSAGNAVSMGNVWNYDVHHNVVDNYNTGNNNHNGIFLMQGNGKFHDNKLTNYQGNSIRMWLFSRGSTVVTNEIYNNICFNTRKYGGFEIQQFDRNIWSGKSTFVNAKVYNNTVGQMNTAKDWEGQVLDLYNIFGTLEFYNNLGFDLKTVKYQSDVTNMINSMGETKIVKEENNKYFKTKDEAVNADLSSKFKGVGASI